MMMHLTGPLLIFRVAGSSDLPCPCVQEAGYGRNQVTDLNFLIIIQVQGCYLKQGKQLPSSKATLGRQAAAVI